MSKGSKRRPSQVSEDVVAENWKAIFGDKPLNIMSDEERVAMVREKNDLAKVLEGLDQAAKGECSKAPPDIGKDAELASQLEELSND